MSEQTLRSLAAEWREAATEADRQGRFINARRFDACASDLDTLADAMEARLIAESAQNKQFRRNFIVWVRRSLIGEKESK